MEKRRQQCTFIFALGIIGWCTQPSPAWGQLQPVPATTEIAQSEEAETPEEEPIELIIIDVFDQPLYTPFRGEGTVRESTRPAYVIDQDEIEAQNWKTVDEALRYLPGILSEGTNGGQLGSSSGQFIRGGNTAQTLILLNGRPINEIGFTGGFDLSNFTTDLVERIEVVPGGGSTLYGSDAIGGTINIVTRVPEAEGIQLNPVLGVGSFGFDQQALQVTGRDGNLGWVVSYNRIDSQNDFPYEIDDNQISYADPTANNTDFDIDENRENADVLYNNVQVKGVIDLSERDRVTISGLYLDKDLGIPSGVPIPVAGSLGEFNRLTPNARQQSEQWLFDITLESQLGNGDDSLLTAKAYLDDLNYNAEDPDSFVVADDVDQTGVGLQVQHNWQFTKNQNLTYGADYRSVDGRNITTLASGEVVENYDGNLSQGALFARYEVDFSPQASVHVGLRQDFNSTEAGSVTSPAVGARFEITPSTTLRANYSQSFRAPLISNLNGLAAFNVEGNPDLKPERGDSFDIGIDQELGDRGLLRFTYFVNDIDDLIAFEFGSPSTFRNIGRVRTTGIETALNIQIAKNVFALANYTLNSPEIKEDTNPELEGNTLSFRGADVLNLGISYETPRGFLVGAFLRNVSDRFADNANTEKLEGYTTVDLKLRVPIRKGLAVNASWNNIFDEDFQEFPGFPGLGSDFRIGIGGTF